MYKNKASDNRNNICGSKLKELRTSMPTRTSQRQLADMLQLAGLDLDKNAVQRIESGERFVTDIELKVISRVLGVSYETLLDN
ncbi:helix-turn-helix transcriptional regulator [Eubacteriaceae bacterium Marseille-Q4139]|nr:helix-turn-helix transcriptional regulator [Eubacteriaceae bacterium Marseille-Q4139]